jgi:hypothetical protein
LPPPPPPAAAAAAPNEMTIVHVLKHVCDHHSQCSEVLEQAFLLIEHLASKSKLCTNLLVEVGFPIWLQRMSESKPSDLYIAALCDLCVDSLDT